MMNRFSFHALLAGNESNAGMILNWISFSVAICAGLKQSRRRHGEQFIRATGFITGRGSM